MADGLKGEQVSALDPWRTEDHHGRYIQPIELLVLRGGTIFGPMCVSGPIGRMDADEVLTSIRGRERRRLEQERSKAAAGA